MSFPSQILSKPYLITSTDYQSLGTQINLVGVDDLQLKKENTKSYASPRILNWVEPYEINGVNKSLFYTEVNSNIQVGDRIWVINGYYDTDALIQVNKYKKGRDGYKVLYVDKCRIVLDINYSGVLPYNDSDDFDDFIKVYKVSSRDEFLNVSKQISSRGSELSYKFDKYQNNIIFIDSEDDIFGPVYTEKNAQSDPFGILSAYHIAGYGVNLGLTGGSGFFVKDGVKYWLNISKEIFYYGSYSVALGTQSNNRMKIMNGDFNYKGFDFKDGHTYEWQTGSTGSYWRIDKNYSQPIISKTNFRSGEFLGTFNNGLFGTQENRITWRCDKSIWKGGTLLNTIWEKGNFESQISFTENYKSSFDVNKNPYQKANLTNNDGYGYNYIIDSYLKTSTIQNGNFINTKIGTSVNKIVLENHLKSINQTFYNNINKAYLEGCEFSSIYINNGTLVNSKIIDTKVVNSRVINSQVYDSVIKDSSFISESSIKINAYDEWNISEYRYTNTINNTLATSTFSIVSLSTYFTSIPDSRTSHKLYKFYISKKDYSKLKSGDFFYLKGIKINDNSKNVLNFFDKKFKLGTWIEFIDDYTNVNINNDYNYPADSFYKRGVEYTAYLSTPDENTYVLGSVKSTEQLNFLSPTQSSSVSNVLKNVQYTDLLRKNPNSEYYSIDIIVSIQDIINRSIDVPNLNFNYDSIATQSSTYLGNNIDISNAFVINSNLESGIFETSDWNSGYNINYSNDSNISSLTGSGDYRILIDFISSTLMVQDTQYLSDSRETNFKQNDIIYLNSIDYINGSSIVRIPDTYKIISVNSNNLILEEVNTSIISGLTAGGYFTTNNSKNRYNYISKVKFEKSKINSGIFKRSYFNKSLIQNSNYDSTDKDYNNLDKIKDLVIYESIFNNNNNILSSATYLNSFFIGGSDKWQDGIIQNSFLNGMTFSKGTIKESRWENGDFTGGLFYNSRTFDGNPNSMYPYYFNNRLKSYYIDGTLSGTTSNNRFSWVNGNFTGGEFYKSDWEDGIFKDGIFNYSKFYKGTFSGGNIGTTKNAIGDTIIYNGDITYATVDSATFYSKDPNYYGTSYSNINWYDGVFNNGVFGSSNDTIYTYITSTTYSTYSNIDLDINSISGSTGILISTTSSITDAVNKDLPFEIKIKLKTNHSYTGDLLINLKAPNGKIINLKGLYEGGGSVLNNIIWSSSDNNNNQTLSQVSNYNSTSPPYFNFKMSKIIGTGSFDGYSSTSSVSNTNDIKDLLNLDSTLTGDWSLIIIDYFGNTDNGKLNNWEITFNYSTIDQQIVFDNKSTWHDGIFNGGQFIDMAKWKNGTFNGGKFISSYGWTHSGLYFDNSIDPLDYSWENGTFNDGGFGSGVLGANSTWNNGIFNGGQFKGRLWNDGIFSNGNFYGSSTYSAIGGLNIDTYDSNAAKFVESYTQSFYGLWVDGIVTTNKDKYLKDIKFYFVDNKNSKKYTTTNFSNVLWLSGTFSNETATFVDGVWLSGTFNKGTFKNSSFNPYVNRGETNLVDPSLDFPRKLKPSDKSFTPNFNPVINMITTKDRSVWLNGDLVNSEFYMSKWYNGNFISGAAYGMVFFDGVSKFMNAYNVIWEGGTWKNGNWHGSDFEYNGDFLRSDGTNNRFLYNIVRRGLRDYGLSTSIDPGVIVPESLGQNNLHIWNLFNNSSSMVAISSISATNITFDLFNEDLSSNSGIIWTGSNTGSPIDDGNLNQDPFTSTS